MLAEEVTKRAHNMVKVLSDINKTQRSTEKEKLEVHIQYLKEQLDYERERDRQSLENVRIAHEHTRLGLMNQEMVVEAIANLVSAISCIATSTRETT